MRGKVIVGANLAALSALANASGFTGRAKVWVGVHTGQSNSSHPNRGETGTIADWPYLFDSLDTDDNSGGVWIPMVGKGVHTGGYDYTIARLLKAAGVTGATINLTAGSTHANEWPSSEPSADEGRRLLDTFDVALGSLAAQFPAGVDFGFYHLRNQGTTDARVNNLQYQTGAVPGTVINGEVVNSPQTYPGWAAFAELWHQDLISHIVSAGFSAGSFPRIVVQSFTGLTLTFHTPAIQRQELIWSGGTPDANDSLVGSGPQCVQLEDAAGYDAADGAHMVSAACTITTGALPGVYSGGGYHWAGTVIAPIILSHI